MGRTKATRRYNEAYKKYNEACEKYRAVLADIKLERAKSQRHQESGYAKARNELFKDLGIDHDPDWPRELVWKFRREVTSSLQYNIDYHRVRDRVLKSEKARIEKLAEKQRLEERILEEDMRVAMDTGSQAL